MSVGVHVDAECKRAGGGVFSAASGSRRNDRWDVYGESEEKEAPPMVPSLEIARDSSSGGGKGSSSGRSGGRSVT